MEKPSTSLGSKDCQRSDNSLARAPSPFPFLLRAFQEFSRAEFLLIYDTFAMPLTRQVACICELFFFSLSLSLPSFLFTQSHSTMPREGGISTRQTDLSPTRSRPIDSIRGEFSKAVGCVDVVRDIDTRDYFGETLEDYYHLWDKTFNGINRGRRKY